MPVTFIGGAKGPARLAFLQLATDTTTQLGSYTFASQNLGDAAADRVIIVAVHWHNTLVNVTLSSATIGGVSATIHIQNDDINASDWSHAAIISAAVPTGATGDIVLTVAALGCAIGTYRAVSMGSQTPHATSSDDDDILSLNINIPANGILLAAGTMVSGAITPTGVTERYDQLFDAFIQITSGEAELLSAETPRTVSFNGATGYAAGVAASWS